MVIDDLRVIRMLGKTGSFSVTAERLFMSQSSVSRCIARVERELGVKLFTRDTHRVEITEAGKLLLGGADKILAEYDKTLSALEKLTLGEQGTIRFAEIYYAMDRHLATPLALFAKRYPNVELQVLPMEPTQVENAIAQGNADLGFSVCCNDIVEENGRSYLRFTVEKLFVILPETHELAKSTSLQARDFEGQRLLFPTGEVAMESYIVDYLEQHDVQPSAIVHCDHVDHYNSAILATDSMAFMPECMTEYPHHGLTVIPFEGDLFAQYYFLWLTDNANPAIKLFLNSL